MASLCSFAYPEFAGAHFKPDRPGDCPPGFFAVDQDPGFPQNLSHAQLISLSDIEDAAVVDYLRSAYQSHGQPFLVRAMLQCTVKQQRNSSVREHVWVGLRSCGIQIRFRKHQMQKATHMGNTVMNGNRDARSERIGHKHSVRIVTNCAIGNSDDVCRVQAAPRPFDNPATGLR